MDKLLEEKKRKRFLLLRKLYDLTDGVPDSHLIDIRQLGPEIGLNAEDALNTFEYLKGEGLAKWMALGGVGTITHWGVKEVEEALEGRETGHFPSNIVIITGSPGANVVAGSGNTVSQHNVTIHGSASEKLAETLRQVAATLPSEAEELLEAASKAEPNQLEVANIANSLASKGSAWKVALSSFVTSVGSGLLVEAIKFGLGLK